MIGWWKSSGVGIHSATSSANGRYSPMWLSTEQGTRPYSRTMWATRGEVVELEQQRAEQAAIEDAGDLLRPRREVEDGLGEEIAQPRQEVLAGAPVAELGEEREVVDPRRLGLDVLRLDADAPAEAIDAHGHLVAHADVAHRGRPVDRQRDAAHRVRQVDEERVRAVLLDVRADAQRVLDAAQRVEHRARARRSRR